MTVNHHTHDDHHATDEAVRELPRIEPDEGDAQPPTTSLRAKLIVVIGAVLVLGGGLVVLLSALSGRDTPQAPPAAASDAGTAFDETDSGPGIPLPSAAAARPTLVMSEPEQPSPAFPTVASSTTATDPATPQATLMPSPAIDSRWADLQARLEAFGQGVEALTRQVRQFDERIMSVEASIAQLETRLAEATAHPNEIPNEKLAQLEQNIASLSSRMKRVETRSRANARRITGQAGARWQGQRLPFEVESVDWWGASPSVAVRRGGQRDFLAPGETVAGWTLVSVDAASRTVRFERNGIEALARVAQ